jgi:hypothetical protein
MHDAFAACERAIPDLEWNRDAAIAAQGRDVGIRPECGRNSHRIPNTNSPIALSCRRHAKRRRHSAEGWSDPNGSVEGRENDDLARGEVAKRGANVFLGSSECGTDLGRLRDMSRRGSLAKHVKANIIGERFDAARSGAHRRPSSSRKISWIKSTHSPQIAWRCSWPNVATLVVLPQNEHEPFAGAARRRRPASLLHSSQM